MLNKYLTYFFLIIILFSILLNIMFFSVQQYSKDTFEETASPIFIPINGHLFWPTPGFYNITSYFGNRISPTTGKPSSHSGIDIGAQEGSYIYAVQSGKVSFVGFNGANGYSIHIQNENFTFIYGHVSPNFIVSVNDFVSTGQIIGNIGPKYVSPSLENHYKDKNGKYTNGATTGPHLHLTIKKDGKAVNPLNLF